MVEPILPAGAPPRDRRPLLGYGMVLLASTLFAVNGTVSKVILDAGLSSSRLAQIRSTGALLGLALVLALTNPAALRLRGRELPTLALFGVFGLALVQWFYFIAIHRLAIGIALLLQYLAPLLVALWARFVYREHVRQRIWVALGLALAGLSLVVEIWSGVALDGRGVAACFAAALSYAFYILVAEHAVSTRDPISVSCFGFLFASLFWAAVQPWWTFPGSVVARSTPLLGHLSGIHAPVWTLVAWMIVLGTIVPFALVVTALRHVSATRAGIAAMLEPPAAARLCWPRSRSPKAPDSYRSLTPYPPFGGWHPLLERFRVPRNAFAHAGCCALRGICHCAFNSFRGFRGGLLTDVGEPDPERNEPRSRGERPATAALRGEAP